MKPEQVAFLEKIAQSSDKKAWQDVFETLIEEVKDDVLAKKVSVDAGNEAVALLKGILNKITILDVRAENPAKNQMI